MAWHFVLINSDGSAVGELTAAKAKKVIWPLDDAASASFTIDGQHAQAALVKELEMDLLVYDDGGAVRFRGRLGTSSDTFGSTGDLATFSAVDYRGFLARRILWPGSTTIFTTIDQAQILWTLISDSQATTDGDLGIVRGTGQVTGVDRTFTFAEGSKLSDLAAQVASVDDGFEWEIDANLNLNIFYPERGSVTAEVLDYGGTVLSGTRTLDTSTFADAIRYSGATALTPVTAESSSFGAAGRWESQIGDTSILDQPTLTLKADFELAQDEVPTPSYELILRSGWWSPDLLWLGDSAEVVIKSGRLDVDSVQRVTQVEVDIGDDGGEVVTVTTGPVIVAQDLKLNDVLTRLDSLERT